MQHRNHTEADSPADDLVGIEKAHQNGELYIWFNHMKTSADYSKADFAAFVARIHSLRMEVVTYSQLLQRIQTSIGS